MTDQEIADKIVAKWVEYLEINNWPVRTWLDHALTVGAVEAMNHTTDANMIIAAVLGEDVVSPDPSIADRARVLWNRVVDHDLDAAVSRALASHGN